MDTVVSLSKADKDEDDGAIKIEFKKARLRTPATMSEFEPKIIKRTDDGWTCNAATRDATGRGEQSQASIIKAQFVRAYDHLADGANEQPGFNGAKVRKVKADAIKNTLKHRGFLETTENGGLTSTARSHWMRAKTSLLAKGGFVESEGLVWRT